MAGGFSQTAEKALLDDPTVGLERSLYVALLKWTGSTGAGDGITPNEDGTLPTNLVEVTGGGYARVAIGAADWAAAADGAAGAPTSKSTTTTKSWTAAGANYGEIVGWAIVNHVSNAISSTTLVCYGSITTTGGVATHQQVNDGQTFQFDSAHPIKVQLGKPADTYT